MRASINWLRELLPELTASPAEIAEKLTMAGLEVEAIEEFGAGSEHCLVVEVVGKERHPERSGLNLVTVNRGTEEQRIVCGAKNVPEAGGLLVLAPLGTTLPAKGMTIEPRPIGGIVSEGMLCSVSELGLGEEADGIWVLEPGSAKAGQKLLEVIPNCRDTVIEIGVTPNRPDALSHVGLARELAALYGFQFKFPEGKATQDIPGDVSDSVAVSIEAKDRCSHYAGGLLRGMKIGPSPFWMQHRLQAVGVRPIDAIVDVTNYVLMEFGQPLHSFDAAKISGGKIVVRCAQAGESLTTLDGKEHKLVEDDLLICDGGGPVALAGIMGGASTEIGEGSQDVFLESAAFNARSVRRAARRHGMHTEASHRFERGVDPGLPAVALERALGLMQELCGGDVVATRAHAKVDLPKAPMIALRRSRLNGLMGADIPFDDAVSILERLGLTVEVEEAGERLRAQAPGYRPDLKREADLIEEVARVWGMHRIEPALPSVGTQAPRTTGKSARLLRSEALRLGLSEALTYAFVSPGELEAMGAETPAVVLKHPLSEERSVLRTSLLTGLVEVVARARRHGERDVRLFTIGRTFHRSEADSGLPTEKRCLGALLAGNRHAHLTRPEPLDVYDAKAAAEDLVRAVTGKIPRVEAWPAEGRPNHYHPRAAGQLWLGETLLGSFGALHPDVVDKLDAGGEAFLVELDIDALEAQGQDVPQAAGVPRVPAITRDLALVVPEATTSRALAKLIAERAGELCEEVEVFDRYIGKQLPSGHVSLAFRVTYRDPSARTGSSDARTLTDKEVDKQHKQVVASVEKELGAAQRA